MAVLSIGQMWGADPSVKSTFSTSSTVTDNKVTENGVTWTLDVTVATGTPAITTGTASQIQGLKFGSSGSNYYSPIKFSTDYFKNYNVKSVTIYEKNNGSKIGTLTVKQGSITIGTASHSAKTSDWATLTASGTTGAGGTLEVTYEVAQASYFNYIEVIYEEGESTCTSEITITKADNPANGTFTLDESGTVCIDEGNATVNVTASPALHYHLASVNSTVGTVGTISNNTCAITNISANTTISATFAEDDKVKVTWNVNGDETLKTDVYVGDKPVFPAKPTACDATSTTFIGWATEPWIGKLADLTGKTVYTSASAMPEVEAAVTYYAVFAKSSGSASELFSWAGGSSSDFKALEGVTLSADNSDYAAGNAPYLIKWNGTGKYAIIPVASQPGKVSASFKMIGGATTSTITVQEADDAEGPFTDVENLAISGSSNDVVNIESTQAFKSTTRAIKLYYTKGSNVGLGPISIEGVVSYSDYMTTCATPTVAVPTISGDEEFISSTTVTLTQAEADAIYYTTNGDEPTTSSTAYTEPFSLTNTATVKAIAVKGGVSSAVAEKDFTKVEVKTTMAEVQAAATSTTDQSINVTISNWVVTAVSGSQVWLADADNTKGILLYKSGHGFTAGKKLNGTVMGTKVKLYNLYPELTSLLASEVSVTDAEAVTPRTTTIAALTSGHPAEQGTVVKLEGVTYESSALSDGVNSIAADNKFFSSLALVEGTTYDITGVVTYYKNGDNAVVKIAPRSIDDVEAQSVVVIPTAANLAALKAAERGTYILTLENAVVSYVNGKNAFIEDATGGALIFFQDHGFTAGNCLNGDYQVITTDYQGKFEITAVEPQAGAATTTADIPLTTVSIATLNENFASYESRRVKIVGANVSDAISGDDRNGAINDGAALAVYAAAGKNTITLINNDNVDIIGYPGFHNTDQQLNVWKQADITVNEKEEAGIAFTPESETITGGDAWSAPEFANPNNLDVEFSSDDETVATVSDAGVVSLEGGYGTAVIAAHTDGDATHNAGNATYTITVNDPASVDTRKVAESPEGGFSSISGDLSGNEISFAAYQGGAATPPNGNNTAHELRLYKYQATTEYGGYVTITAKTGCLIDQVVITVGGNCNVGWCKDAESLPTKEDTPIAIGTSSAFDTGTGLDASSVSVVNIDESNQFKIKTITVYYNGEAITLESIAIGGEASALEYNDGDEFNPAGLVVTGHYSDNSEAEISDGITWAFDPSPLTAGTTSVSVTATVGEISSSAFVVNGLTVSAAAAPTTDNVVILAVYNETYYAMSTTNANNGFTAIEVEYNGTQVTVNSAEDKAAIQWTKTTNGDNTTFQDADSKYMKSADGASMSLNANVCNWVWDATGGYYKISGTSRTFFFQNASGGIFKNYATSNLGGNGYSDKAQVIAIAAENIIITSKVSAELAYDPAEVELTVGDDFTPAVLTYAEGFDGLAAVTYESSNLDLATIEGGVVSLVADATGTATITATFAGNNSYLAGSASYTITVNEPGDDLTGTWVLASSVAAGDKIIIMGANNADIYTMGKQNTNNRAAVASTLSEDVLNPGAATKVFTLVDAGEGKFAIQASNGNYLTSATSGTSNNLLEAADYDLDNAKWTITIDGEGVASVVAAAGSKTVMQYNSSNTLFSCYGSANQKPVKIFKRDAAPEPQYTEVRNGLTEGWYYTMCLDKAVTAVQGGSIWRVLSKAENGTDVILEEVTGTLDAGRPYIFFATASTLQVVYAGAAVNGPVNDAENNGLIGSFTKKLIEQAATNYIIYNNALYFVNTDNVYVGAHRAYLDMTGVPAYSNEPQQGAPRRRVVMAVNGQNGATGFENINATEKPMKLMIDGKIYILRGEKMFDATGRLVK